MPTLLGGGPLNRGPLGQALPFFLRLSVAWFHHSSLMILLPIILPRCPYPISGDQAQISVPSSACSYAILDSFWTVRNQRTCLIVCHFHNRRASRFGLCCRSQMQSHWPN